MFFDALGLVPLGFPEWYEVVPATSQQGLLAYRKWHSVAGTGYCASVTIKLETKTNDSAQGVTLQLNSIDVMFENASGLI